LSDPGTITQHGADRDCQQIGEMTQTETDSLDRGMSVDDVLDLLLHGSLELEGRLPWSSNYTLLAKVVLNGTQGLAVYKPRRGERPLWDFPDGSLCLREVATFLVSQALGWGFVPPTILRDGPHGLGSVQLYIASDPDEHYFTLQNRFGEEFRHVAIFDYVINNADRKAGHCLLGVDERIWVVDHGVTFHRLPKLRTVIWDFAGDLIPDVIMDDLRTLQADLQTESPLNNALTRLLSPGELQALRRRVADLLHSGIFPRPDPSRRHTPWPPV
jgi:hypothetical protein